MTTLILESSIYSRSGAQKLLPADYERISAEQEEKLKEEDALRREDFKRRDEERQREEEARRVRFNLEQVCPNKTQDISCSSAKLLSYF